MAYKRFDDPALTGEAAPRKVYNAMMNDAVRRALQSVLNRVITGKHATDGTSAAALAQVMATGVGTGGTGGIGTTAALAILLNGRAGTRASAGSYWLPSGTQSASTYVKYGIFGGFGTSGTVLAGNESTASTTAYLPDCPDGYLCLGYMEYLAGTSAWNRGANVVTGQTGSSGTGTFTDLVHMPLYET